MKKAKMIDYLWVLQAFLRGKVLRQKAYRPQGNIFRAMPGGSIGRMLILIRWWGYRPMTLEEALESMKDEKGGESTDERVPCCYWTGSKLTLGWDLQGNPNKEFGAFLIRRPWLEK